MYNVVTNITDPKSTQKDIDKPTYLFITFLSTPQNGLSSLSSLITITYRCDIDLPYLYWNFHPFSFVFSIQPPTKHVASADKALGVWFESRPSY
jgi:hypothetical protein